MRYIEQQQPLNANLTAWRTVRYDLERSADIARYIAREHYAWPGGYELFAVMRDGECLCFDCCRTEYREIARADSRSDWRVVGMDSTECSDPETWGDDTCAHCGRTIGGEPEVQQA